METSEYGRDGFGQHFERGSIYWSERGGAHRVFGGIGERYQEFDGVQGRLGYPLTDELTSGRSPQGTTGVFQRFEGARDYPDEIDMNPVDRAGATIYWSESLGAHVTWDAIGKLYERGGGTTGELGFPTSSPKEAKPQTVKKATFSDSKAALPPWTPVGAFSILGAINALYVHLGGSRGQFGFPIGPEGREEIDDSGPVLMQQIRRRFNSDASRPKCRPEGRLTRPTRTDPRARITHLSSSESSRRSAETRRSDQGRVGLE